MPAGMQGLSSKQQTILEWMQSPEGKTEITEAEKDAWVPFNRQFPNAEKSQFVAKATVESKDKKGERGNIFQQRSGLFAERVRL